MSRGPSQTRRRIGRRMLALFVACALVPMCVLAAFALGGVARQLDEQTDAYLGRVCRDACRLAVDGLDDVDVELQAVAERLGEMGEVPALVRGQVEAWRGVRVRALALLSDGEVVAASREFDASLPTLTPAQRAHLAAGQALLVVDPPGARRGEFVLMRRLPQEGAQELLLAGQASTARLLRQYEFAQDDVEFCLFLLGGRLIASSLSGEHEQGAVLDALRSARQSSGRFSLELDGTPWLAAHRTTFLKPRFLADVGVVAGISRREVRGPVVYFQRVFLLLTLLSTGAAVLLASTQIRRYLHPLAVLRAAAGRVAAGEEDVRTGIESGDELEELSGAFDEMAARVRARTTELERANRAKSDFLANVSHELRTPMTAILGYVDMCLEPELAAPERERNLRVVADSGRHLLAVINDILDVSRIEAGHLEVVREPCSLASLVSDVASLMAVAARQKGLSFLVRCAEPVPVRVRSDPTRVRQVLLNLIGNALKFTERGGVELVLRGERAEGGGERLAFDVRDTGCGIPPEHQERVFEPFAQADGSLARRHGGTGLGLSIARRVARALGGDVRCESRPGEGSTFTFTLDPGPLEGVERIERLVEHAPDGQGAASDAERPAPPAEGGEPRPALPARPRFAGQRILLAEDAAVNLRLISAMLERDGLVVDPAENGRVAAEKLLAALAAGEPHELVLTDVQMPEMDGYELARHLRASGYEGPIVALTAHSMEGERERCLAAGCDAFASKPIDRAALHEVLAGLLGPSAERRKAREPGL